ncbi:MAG: nucleotide disphospho-sugar-binding domain-containing protein [Kofleriaceae bacterium]
MPNVLVYTTPGRGHLYPIMDTALVLAQRGHHVHLRTLAAEVDRVESAGLHATAISGAIESREPDDWQVRSPRARLERSLQTFIDRGPLEIDDLRSAIELVRPDLLLVDTNAWGAQAAAENSRIPWATWHPYPLPFPSKDAPPFGPGLRPARGVLGKLRDRILQPLVIGPLQKFLPALNRIRSKAGVLPFSHIKELFTRPPLLLHMTAEPFEYSRSDWPANVRLVGPGLWSPPAAVPAWLSEATQPIVLVTCSTEFQDDGALVDAALAAFGTDASVQLVCTTAGVAPARFRAPPGVVIERFLAHALLLSRACSVVCHGGMGITQRALAAGVPPCVVPWGRDQLEVGRRVVESRCGALLPRASLTPARLRDAVVEARGSATGAARIAAAFATAGGAERAATLLEALLPAGAGPLPGL